MGMLEKFCDVKNTFEGKALAVFMSFVLAFSLVSLTSLASAAEGEASSDAPAAATADDASDAPADPVETPAADPVEQAAPETAPAAPEATEPAQSEPEAPATTEPQAPVEEVKTVEPGVASVSLDFTHAYVKYLGQTIALPTESMNAPLNKELVFSSYADTGYEIDHVKTVVNGTETELEADEETGEYTVPADQVTSNLVIEVEAKAVEQGDASADAVAKPLDNAPKNEAEKPADEQAAPAITLTETVDGAIVTLEATEGVLPEGATMKVVPLTGEDVKGIAEQKATEEGRELVNYVAFDVTLYDAEGNEIQPNGPVSIAVGSSSLNANDTALYHADENIADVEKVAEGTEASLEHFSPVLAIESRAATSALSDSSIEGSGTQSDPYLIPVGETLTMTGAVSPSGSCNWSWSSGKDNDWTWPGDYATPHGFDYPVTNVASITGDKPSDALFCATYMYIDAAFADQITYYYFKVVEAGSTEPATAFTALEGSKTIAVGSTTKLTIATEPAKASTKGVVWSSSNANIASVDSKGVVTGVKQGKAVITAALPNTDVTASTTIEVTAAQPTVEVAYFYALTPGGDPMDLHSKSWLYVGKGSINTTGLVDSQGKKFVSGQGQFALDTTDRVITYPEEASIKEAVAQKYGVSVEEVNIEYQPYKITYPKGWKDSDKVSHDSNKPCWHVDMTISFTAKEKASAVYHLWDAGETGYAPVENYTLNINETTAPKSNAYPEVKTDSSGVNYRFDGWYTNEGCTGEKVTFPYTLTGAADFYARYVAVSRYTVNYDGNGAESGTVPFDRSTYEHGNAVEVKSDKVPQRAGYTFTGWNTSSDGTGTTYQPGETFSMPESDTTLYAQWAASASSYAVEYYYQEQGSYPEQASLLESRQELTDSEVAVTAQDRTPARDGYVLDETAQSVYEGTVAGDGSLVLKVYFKQQFVVSFLPGDQGTFAAVEHDALEWGASTPAAPEPTGEPGYIFSGWSPEYKQGSEVAASVDYVAQWSERDVPLVYAIAETGGGNVTDKAGDQKGRVTDVVRSATGTPVGSTAVPLSGYEFEKWTVRDETVSDRPTLTSEDVDRYAKASGAYTATEFVAWFKESSDVTLTYVAGEGGSVSRPNETLAPATGAATGSTAEPQPGYRFVKWTATAADGTTVDASEDATLTASAVDAIAKKSGAYENTTFTAHFEQESVIISYEATEGGSVSPERNGISAVDGGVIGSAAKADEHYYFAGWSVQGSDKIISTDNTISKAVVEKYAKNTEGAFTETTFVAHFAAKRKLTVVAKSDSLVYNGKTQVQSDTVYIFDGGERPRVSFSGDEASAEGIDVGEYPVKFHDTSNFQIIDDKRVDVTYQYDVTFVEGMLEITPRPINATGDGWDEPQEYTGFAYSKDTYKVEGFNYWGVERGLVHGHLASADYSISGTEPGEYKGSFDTIRIVDASGKDVTSNYDINKTVGNLEIVASTQPLVITANSQSWKYDGSEHSDNGYTVSYGGTAVTPDSDGTYTLPTGDKVSATVSGTVTNVADSGVGNNAITGYEVQNVDRYTNVATVNGTLSITPRTVELTSATASKPYDGTALTASGITESGDGWIAGEGAEYNVTGSQTAVASSDNTFEYTLKDGTTVGNYTITQHLGTLTVEGLADDAKFEITVEANSLTDTYDGTAKSASGLKQTQFTFGDATFTVTGLDASFTETNAGTYGVNVTGTPVVTDEKGNVVTDQFIVKTTAGSLVIKTRDLTLASATLSKVYDGTPLVNGNTPLAEQGWVDGEGATYEFKNSVTLPNETKPNDFTISPNEGTSLDNYNVTTKPGQLTIENRPEDIKYAVDVTASSGTFTYDGTAKQVSGFEGETDRGIPVQADGRTYYVKGLESKAEGTNVADSTGTVPVQGIAQVLDESNNDVSSQFKVTVHNGSLAIGKRTVTLASDTLSKEYDGMPLTNGETPLATEDGWVDGQGATYQFTGSVTLPNTMAPNAFTVMPKPGTILDNYQVDKTEGTLRVTNRDAQYEVTLTANSLSETYDGTTKSVSGFVGEENGAVAVQAGDQTYYVSGLTASASGTNADTYQTVIEGTAVVADAAGNVVTDQFNVNTIGGSLVIDKRPVTLQSASDEKPYDGTPLENHAVDVTAGSWANDEGATYRFTGSVTLPGETAPNAFEIVPNAGTNLDNYNLRKIEGQLTILNRDAKYDVTMTANSGTFTYDGTEKKVSGFENETDQGIPVVADGRTYYVKGLTSSASGTNADTYQTTIAGTAVVVDAAGNVVTGQFNVKTVDGSLVIDKRVVDLISASDEKPYDGTPLTNDTVDVMGDGWAPGQGASYNVTGSQTVVGFSDNTFTYVLTGGASEENYTITPMFGSLRVYNADAKFEVTVAANSDTVTYDGEQHAVSGLVGETDKGVLVQANGLDFYVSGLSANAEGIDANTYAANVIGTPVVKDAADNDVTDQFDVKTVGGSLTIEKRTVTMTSATAEKYYDGTPLKDSTVTVPEGSWADGEGATYQVTGSQTKIGSSPNTFTYTLTGATKAENYNINPVEGALTVKSRDARFDLTLEANSLAATYDGTEKSVSGLKQTEFTIDGATFTVSGVTAEAKGTDARVYQVVPHGDVKIVDSEGNDVTDQFNVTFKEGSLTIEKRPLTLTSATLSKRYDGTPLTNGDTPLYLEQGWAEGEGATYEFTESVTLPGATASNEFNIHANAGTKLENYATTKSVGQLTIEDRNEDAKYAIDLEANSGAFLYDGQQKSVDGFVQTEFAFGGVTYTVTGLAASATRTDAGTTTVGISGTPVVKDAAGNDVTSQFKITLVPGTLKVDKRSVVLESATDSKPYDGTELVNDNVAVAGDGWADGEGAAYNVTGSQTLVGFSSNTFTYALTGGTKAENYSIDTREGTLTVTNRDAKYEATVEADSATFQYDGEKKTVSGFKNETVDGIHVQVGALTYYVAGLTASAELTDAGTVQVKATGNPTVRDAAGNDVTSEFNIKSVAGSLSVEKRQVNLTSATDTKEYDGEALVAHDVIVSGDGWADGEGASYSYTGSQTLVGSSPNHFEATLNANTKAENYTMKLIEGTLTVTNRNATFNVTVKAASDTALYDGSEHDVSGFENETAQGIPVLAGGNTYYVTGLSANAAGTDAGTYVARVAGTPVVLDAAGNDVSDQFSVTPETGKLVVSKRSVVLQSGSGTKAYDGTELVNHNIAVSGDGWATGEGADYSFTGTQTLVGTSDNMFDYALNGGAKAENYQIDKRYGSLTVTNRGAQYAVTVTANSATVTYDGSEQSVAGLQNQTDQGVAVQADGRTYYVSGLAADVAGTNAGTYTATVSGTPVVRDADGNDVSDQFAVTTQPGSLVIEQRPLTLESANLSKKYDGRPLTNGSEPLAVEDGWATGEGAAYVFTGSATLPGETAPNAFVIKVNDGTNLDNYVVSKVEGQLSVENRDARYDATVTAQSGTFTYDGTAHAVDGFVDQTAQGIPVQADGQTYYVSGLTSKASGANVADSMATIPVEGVAVVKDADGNDVSDQFNIKVQAGSFTIDPAELVIAANDTGKRYGDGDPALTASVSGLVAGDTFNGSYVLTRTAGENAGTYDITVSDVQLGALSNYTATTLAGRFIIAPAGEVTLVVNDSSKTYDGTPLEPSGFNPIGLAPGDTVEVTYGGSQTDAGTSEGTITDYVIRNAADEDVTANYPTINIEPGTLRVDPMQVVITVDDASKTAGSADPVFSGSVQGLVNPDDLGAITYVRTGAGTDEAVGVYADAITVDYAANPNYAVKVVPGTFTITAGGTVGPVTPTPATPGTTPPATPTPLPTPGTPPADNPLTPIVTPIVDALANAAETVIGDNATPLAQNQPRETEIEDDGTPLAAGSHAWCWVHWYIILGIIVSVIYAACVALRRGLFSHKLKKYEDDLTGGGDPAPGDPSANDNVTVPLMPKGAPAGATLAAGLGE
ncbi:MBG domain-containing protein [Eggerthella timonensis]|uniref:MBG domain-containing protein n=1 Tax=Eggerthella timonensis TaxID=1871008 RepID=UPI000C773767|nr:MBG domain-containing protein [Eggerthella timonensis]